LTAAAERIGQCAPSSGMGRRGGFNDRATSGFDRYKCIPGALIGHASRAADQPAFYSKMIAVSAGV